MTPVAIAIATPFTPRPSGVFLVFVSFDLDPERDLRVNLRVGQRGKRLDEVDTGIRIVDAATGLASPMRVSPGPTLWTLTFRDIVAFYSVNEGWEGELYGRSLDREGPPGVAPLVEIVGGSFRTSAVASGSFEMGNMDCIRQFGLVADDVILHALAEIPPSGGRPSRRSTKPEAPAGSSHLARDPQGTR